MASLRQSNNPTSGLFDDCCPYNHNLPKLCQNVGQQMTKTGGRAGGKPFGVSAAALVKNTKPTLHCFNTVHYRSCQGQCDVASLMKAWTRQEGKVNTSALNVTQTNMSCMMGGERDRTKQQATSEAPFTYQLLPVY